MRILNFFAITIVLLTLTGCSRYRMYFHNGDFSYSDAKKEVSEGEKKTFAIAVNNSFEVSDPVDLSQSCKENQWKTIKTQQTLGSMIIENATSKAISPWTVQNTCKE